MGGLPGQRVIHLVDQCRDPEETDLTGFLCSTGSEGTYPSKTAGSWWLNKDLLVVRALDLITGGLP